MTDPIYFHDNARRAAEHILSGAFGDRLRQLGAIEVNETYEWLSLDAKRAENYLSSGELVLLGVLESLAGRSIALDLSDLDRLDDGNWSRVIAALFIARGRVMAGLGTS